MGFNGDPTWSPDGKVDRVHEHPRRVEGHLGDQRRRERPAAVDRGRRHRRRTRPGRPTGPDRVRLRRRRRREPRRLGDGLERLAPEARHRVARRSTLFPIGHPTRSRSHSRRSEAARRTARSTSRTRTDRTCTCSPARFSAAGWRRSPSWGVHPAGDSCTIEGTVHADRLIGTKGADVICGGGGQRRDLRARRQARRGRRRTGTRHRVRRPSATWSATSRRCCTASRRRAPGARAGRRRTPTPRGRRSR